MGRLASVRRGRPGVLAARRAPVAAAPAPGISGLKLMRFCGRSKPENSTRMMPSGRRRQSGGRRRRRWRCAGGPGGRCAWSLLYGWRVLAGGRGVLLRLGRPEARCDQCCYSHRDPRRAALGFCLNRAAPPAHRRRPRSVCCAAADPRRGCARSPGCARLSGLGLAVGASLSAGGRARPAPPRCARDVGVRGRPAAPARRPGALDVRRFVRCAACEAAPAGSRGTAPPRLGRDCEQQQRRRRAAATGPRRGSGAAARRRRCRARGRGSAPCRGLPLGLGCPGRRYGRRERRRWQRGRL
jgi:hypothetical protein